MADFASPQYGFPNLRGFRYEPEKAKEWRARLPQAETV